MRKKLNILLLSLLLGICVHPENIFAQKKSGEMELHDFLIKRNYATIPLSKSLSGHLSLIVHMNDTSGVFILDTGAGGTVLDEKKQKKYKQDAKPVEGYGIGAGGALELKSAVVNNFIIGSHVIDSIQLYVVNLDNINDGLKQMGLEEVDGVIGADVLTNGNAIIDYKNLVLYLKK